MDKIREEFEKERNISHDGGSLSYIIFQSGYHSGCKSRDEEIIKLKDENIVFWDARQSFKAEMIKRQVIINKQKKEIKKLRDALESIFSFGITIPGVQQDKQTMKNIAKEALKDSE